MTRDLALGAAALAGAAAYYAAAAAIQETQLADAVGPAGLPKAYAVVLAGLSLALVARSIASRRVRQDSAGIHKGAVHEGRDVVGARPIRRLAGLLAIGIVYIVVVPWLGYAISLAGLLAATMYYQGGTLTRQAALVALSGALFFWVLFVWLLRIPQPAGMW